MQPQGHVQVLCNIVDFGLTPQQATDVPRVVHDGSPAPSGGEMTNGGQVLFETGLTPRCP